MTKNIFFLVDGEMPESLAGYNKVASIYELLNLELPTLPGLVIADWNSVAASVFADFVESRGWKQVLLRSDRRPELPNNPRGGSIFHIEQARSLVQEILESGRIALVLEPVNRYDNLYGINVRFDLERELVFVEAVGPGFDVSDINRGDISPHEKMTFDIEGDEVKTRILSYHCIDQHGYLRSVDQRLVKIGRTLPGRPSGQVSPRDERDFRALGHEYLIQNNFCALLDAMQSYSPLPERCIRRLVAYIRDLPWRLRHIDGLREYVISCSILPQSPMPRFIFWDIVRPSKKYALSVTSRDGPLGSVHPELGQRIKRRRVMD